MRLEKASKEAIKFACLNFHYAKSIPVNITGYSVFNDSEEWCGCIIYGTGSNNNIACGYGLVQGEVIELVRVALNGKQECTSKALSVSLKMIKNDCPLVRLIVSYADLDQNHLGIIYQATNWFFVGVKCENIHDSSFIIKGKRVHGRTVSGYVKGKMKEGMTRLEFLQKNYDSNAKPFITKGKVKYLYPLDRKMRKMCLEISKPYIKNESKTESTELNKQSNNSEKINE